MKRTFPIALIALPAVLAAQEKPSSCSAHHAGSRHEAVDERGDRVMGFDHARTTHRFVLTPDGGVIEVSANSPEDAASRDAIRSHLAHIAPMFAEGDFEAPMLIHDQVPPGVPVMKRDRKKIRWTYEETPSGGRIVAATKDAAVREAIHAFLRFQIEDHRTGDSKAVPAR